MTTHDSPKCLRMLLAVAISFLLIPNLRAEEPWKPVSGNVSYQPAGEFTVERLNRILTTEKAEFSTFKIGYAEAKNPVKLYRVRYTTTIPEKNGRPVTVSGLVAVPQNVPGPRPILSYQHGTVFSRTEAPSNPEESAETRLMVANFAAQGYVVVAADYVGKGLSEEPEGYVVPDVTAQTCVDMLQASRAVLADLRIPTGDLFLSGWSQGAYNTLILLRRLESLGMPVRAAATASTPTDVYASFNRWMNVSSPLDVDWIVGSVSLLLHSYEEYYGLPGLTRAAIKPQYWQTTRDFYLNKITWAEASRKLPAKTRDLLQEDFLKAGATASNRFFIQLKENTAHTFVARTPTRVYYGEADEIIPPFLGTLPEPYQKTVGGAPAQAVFAGKQANHRGTFLFGIKDQKAWFDGLLKQPR